MSTYLYGLLLAALLVAAWLIQSRKRSPASWLKLRSSCTDPGKSDNISKFASQMPPAERPFGTWTPSDFKRLKAKPDQNWSVVDTEPVPYRPFRCGPTYKTTMGLRKMDWDEWIELDNQYLRYHEDKKQRMERYGSKCCRTAADPRVFDGAVELLEELSSFLSERYPSMFKKTDIGVDNNITGEHFNVKELTMNGQKENPMQMCARLVQDDLDIMFEGDDGLYYLRATGDFLSGPGRMEERFGMSLSDLHTSSGVPEFKSKLEKGMISFFRRLRPESPVVRNNYFIQVDDKLYGDEGNAIGWHMVRKNRAIEHHHLRTERQSLRRLPRSGGVVFTIRTYLTPITELAKEPYVPGRLASAIRSWGEDVSKYKGRDTYGNVLLDYLDSKHAEQIANGLDVTHNDGNYPW